MKHKLAGIAALLLAGCAANTPQPSLQNSADEDGQARATASAQLLSPGIYGNVSMSRRTGDLGGFELRFDRALPGERLEIVMCEGWCNRVENAIFVARADALSFDYPMGDDDVIPMKLVSAGRNAVLLTLQFKTGAQTYRLKRMTQEFGLSVARTNAQ